MGEDVNSKDHKSFPLAHQFVLNNIFPCTSIKQTNQFCGKVLFICPVGYFI